MTTSVHDVFISYAHADNEIPDGAERGWVTSMVDALRKRVRAIRGGASPDIWMDHALQPNDVVSEELQALAAGSRTLVLVMSRGYLRSRWCQRELATFLDAHATTRNRESVFIVETYPTDRGQWQERLRSLSQVPFWEKKFEDPAPRLYGYPIPDPRTDRLFFDRVNELAHFVAKRLDEVAPVAWEANASSILAEAPGRAAPDVAAPRQAEITPTIAQSAKEASKPSDHEKRLKEAKTSDSPIVWVAEPPIEDGELILHRESLATSLRQAGAVVVPGGVGSYSRASVIIYRDEVAEDIARARVLVQLFGRTPGHPLAGSEESIASIQYHLARARDPNYLRWRSPEIDLDATDNPVWRTLLESASESSLEEFKQRVLSALQGEPGSIVPPIPSGKLPIVTQTPTAATVQTPLTISVNAIPADAGLRDQVADALEDLEASVLLLPEPSESMSSAEFRKQYEGIITESHGVVIVYGSAPPTWALSAFQMSKKLLAQSRRGVWGALVDGPPPQKASHGIRARNELMVLDCRERTLDRSILEPFVSSLRAGFGVGAGGV